MALRVEKSLLEGPHLVVEAGTGTGKTLAYMYPSLRYSLLTGKRIIISTGTKGLQEQLFYKDVPFLESLLGPFDICYMKGRSNYLCRQKLYDIKPASLTPDENREYKVLVNWEKKTETGDRAEIPAFPEKSTLWPRVDARTDACIGKECASFERCFVSEMRSRAESSNLVIINHHLFFTDLAIKMKTEDASILPAAHAVVFDEAHELEHVASDCFGISVSNRRIGDLARDIRQAIVGTARANAIVQAAARMVDRFALLCTGLPGKVEPSRVVFGSRSKFLQEYDETYEGVLSSMKYLHLELSNLEDLEGAESLVSRTSQLYGELRYLLESKEENAVFWVERRLAGPGAQMNVFIQATPIDVAETLSSSIFERYNSVVLASATLAVQNGFSHVRRSLGITEADEMIVPSIFDYQKQALLYVPPDMPDPRDPSFFESAKKQVLELLKISKGRAFCLFTSYELMQKMHAALEGELPYPMLLHGTMTRKELLESFRTSKNAVLFGTSSFWQGIDVQGEQLSCVIIDRLPFSVPSDPILQARVKAIETRGGSGFFDYQVPKATIALKQGFGRLIRSTTDRGILAMLDPRIQHPGYGKMFTESLPPYRVTNEIEDLRTFMSGCAA
ncbi:ATP-dependent DNA helicase [Edaphobacter modestus]|nr:helicase C-terminal domain-containing protein [Edaphobacter modestus]